MADIKTVRIKGGQDEPELIIINEEDFNDKTMELFVEVETKPSADEVKAETKSKK